MEKAKRLMTEDETLGALKYLHKVDGLLAYKMQDKETGLWYIRVEKWVDEIVCEDNLESMGFTKHLMMGTGELSSGLNKCEPIYYYTNGRVAINCTYHWTWFLDGEQDNRIAVSTRGEMEKLLKKYNGE